MKNLILSVAVFTSLSGLGQPNNLVPNGSFETYVNCPNNYGQVNEAVGWQKSMTNNNAPSLNDHADYFNSCASGNFGFSTPANAWGIESPCDGRAYVGLTSMYVPYGTDYRENIYVQLNSTLIPGTPYYVGFCVSKADFFQFSTNNIGVKFGTVPNFPINNIAHINSTSIITNQNGWVTVQGIFVPDSAYSYLAIGNFFTDANTSQITTCPTCDHDANLYYIDNVRVTKICGWIESSTTGDPYDKIEHGNLNLDSSKLASTKSNTSLSMDIIIFPSIIEDNLTIQYNISSTVNDPVSYEILDVEGKIIKSGNINFKNSNKLTLDFSNLKSGFYLCKIIKNGSIIKSQKIIKD